MSLVNSKIILISVFAFSQVVFAAVSSSEAPLKIESSVDGEREPASVGSAIIKNEKEFTIEAYGESRAKEHLKERNYKQSQSDDFIQEVEGL